MILPTLVFLQTNYATPGVQHTHLSEKGGLTAGALGAGAIGAAETLGTQHHVTTGATTSTGTSNGNICL